MRVLSSLVVVALAACSKGAPSRELPVDAIRVTGDFKVRTDTVGGDKFTHQATFLLVDAENTAEEGAYVTLGGALVDAGGATIGRLNPQSLWVPPHERRTFALVDSELTPRPTSTSARIEVRSALASLAPPPAHIDALHVYDDYGKTVVQGSLVNDATRPGKIMVIASFHDAHGEPMTRPFELMPIAAKATRTVQFVGPPGSTTGTIFIGDAIY
jgi:hypothetical protein